MILEYFKKAIAQDEAQKTVLAENDVENAKYHSYSFCSILKHLLKMKRQLLTRCIRAVKDAIIAQKWNRSSSP